VFAARERIEENLKPVSNPTTEQTIVEAATGSAERGGEQPVASGGFFGDDELFTPDELRAVVEVFEILYRWDEEDRDRKQHPLGTTKDKDTLEPVKGVVPQR
jgi:hypothetical protein